MIVSFNTVEYTVNEDTGSVGLLLVKIGSIKIPITYQLWMEQQ